MDKSSSDKLEFNSIPDLLRSSAGSQLSSGEFKDWYLQWGMPFHRTVASKVGCVPGEIYHLWQGDAKNRNYRERFKVLADFNPDEDLYIGDNGARQWTKPKSALAEQLKAHFVNRREDG